MFICSTIYTVYTWTSKACSEVFRKKKQVTCSHFSFTNWYVSINSSWCIQGHICVYVATDYQICRKWKSAGLPLVPVKPTILYCSSYECIEGVFVFILHESDRLHFSTNFLAPYVGNLSGIPDVLP